jgi:hypothetical protein
MWSLWWWSETFVVDRVSLKEYRIFIRVRNGCGTFCPMAIGESFAGGKKERNLKLTSPPGPHYTFIDLYLLYMGATPTYRHMNNSSFMEISE